MADQSFISVSDKEDNSKAIVNMTILLDHEPGLKVVAEGVETQAHRCLLQQMGCEVLQG